MSDSNNGGQRGPERFAHQETEAAERYRKSQLRYEELKKGAFKLSEAVCDADHDWTHYPS